jgi:hypothetical protein
MKRSEFLRTAILAAIATPVLLPKILEDQPNKTIVRYSVGIPFNTEMLAFKVNDQYLKEQALFDSVIKSYSIDREIKNIEIGLMDDDFVMGLKTVNITFV